MPNAFASLQPTPRSHFLLHYYGAVLRLLRYVEQSEPVDGEGVAHRYPFLARYRDEFERFLPQDAPPADAVDWWEAEIRDWQRDTETHLPLVALESLAAVGGQGRAVLMLAGLVQEDSRFGTLYAHLQEPLPSRRLTLGVVSQLLARNGMAAEIDSWETCRGLFDLGAMTAANPTAPRAEWMLHVPAAVWDAARGSLDHAPGGWCMIHPQTEYPALDALILPDDFLQRLGQTPAILAEGKASAFILRGTPGSDRLLVAGAMARALGRAVIEVNPPPSPSPENPDPLHPEEGRERPVAALAILANAIPVYSFELGPGETATLPDLLGYAGPVLVLMGTEGGLRGSRAEQALTLTLPPPDLSLRLRFWQSALNGAPVQDLEGISARFILPDRYIRQTAAMAVTQARLDHRETVELNDVRQAARALNRQMLDTLADRIESGGAWHQLVVGTTTLGKLHELQQRCLFRERLLDHLGSAFGSSANRGVRALFSGASGTGKTLAARILAAELGMDLYRVDLASVINKYIGETEKNLHQVLSRAEELDIILLLDEGDALLGQRTDVKSSNDRYANLETNYLLQRLEHYQGIVLVTTNAAQNIDTAFQRRMDVVVQFVPPQVDERWAIWQLHLPNDHSIGSDLLGRVAASCDLTGGQIRNAAQLATLLAVSEGNRPLGNRHLIEALRAEYRKAGAICPLEEARLPALPRFQLHEFIRLLT
ncbi:MAG: ATP-binding protein [Caldilineaceae bacterium]|nr:ATP-binding protein [Caldilineaceae bacterium]